LTVDNDHGSCILDPGSWVVIVLVVVVIIIIVQVVIESLGKLTVLLYQ
jgi:hypothetical protein